MSGSGQGGRRRTIPRGVWRLGVLVVAAIILLPFILTVVYSAGTPVSTLMLARRLGGRPVVRDWRPLADIGEALPRAVINGEDARFCDHGGVDWQALGAVVAAAGPDGPARGASTIAMQTVKNLFLWPGAPYLRKPIEIVLASWADLVWGKRRELEIYLNIAQWGPDGIFGAEAAARHGFRRGVADLTARQAATLAAALPNPIARDPAHPDAAARGWAATIAARVRQGGADLSCLDATARRRRD